MNPSYWFILHNDSLLIHSHGEPPFITEETVLPLQAKLTRQYFLGTAQDHDIYCAELAEKHSLANNLAVMPLRQALESFGTDWYSYLVKAYTINNWDKNHQFCGRCGNPTKHIMPSFERICTVCSQLFYPRISPSVIALIHKDKQILMARSPHFAKGIYGLIAGFVEAGESAEMALRREVAEEVSLKIKNLEYFGSQPWPFPDSLMFAFIAEYDSGDIVIDAKEIESAAWYDIDALPGRPSHRVSIATKLIDHFIAKHRK